MKENTLSKKSLIIIIVALFFTASFSSSIATSVSSSIEIYGIESLSNDIKSTHQEFPLPSPIKTDMILEESIFRRKSVRNFTDEPVTNEDLSTVLWAAYGLREDKTSTVPGIGGVHATIIYVLKDDAAYTYNPENHSLVFYKNGDWRDIVGHQYHAPIQLGLCYDTEKLDRNFSGAEGGMIDQNIQFMANALGLGTVVTAQHPPAINPLGIPDNQEGFTVLPLGHPEYDSYKFVNRPMWISLLPRLKRSEMSLSDVLNERKESGTFEGDISRKELSQIVWATGGFSPYRDKSDEIYHKGRHRSIPSGKGYYPIDIYVVKNKAIFKYEPGLLSRIFAVPVDLYGMPIITYLSLVKFGSYKQTIADACMQQSISDASIIILFILDREKTRPPNQPDLSFDEILPTWFHDAGAGAYNILLEATAWDLSANIYEIKDGTAIIDMLKLNEETTIPIFAVPIGN